MNRVRNRRIQSNVGLIVSVGSTVYVIRIGLKYNGVLPMLNDIGRNLEYNVYRSDRCVLPMLNDIGRSLEVLGLRTNRSVLSMLNGIG